jgi:tRNA A-37 threonylcarbamoyl transferase component Bud32
MDAPLGSGRFLAGRYRLRTELGSGGMGTVWLAQDELLDRQVAVKEISPPPEVSESEREVLRQRTLREARTAARLSHPNVVAIYDVVEDGGRPWIVMALIRARSLWEIVQQDGPLTPPEGAKVALQVLAALDAAHALGIMHRDVKPGNVLIDDGGRAVLTDFGIARADDSPTITSTGVLVGSPSYIAPERARGERGGPASDLWSLGATLYAAVEGRPPYDRPGALATLTAVVTEDPDPPSRLGPLWPVIKGLLDRDPAQRLGSAAAEPMLRRIAEDRVAGDSMTGEQGMPATAPFPVLTGWEDDGEAEAGQVPSGGRLEEADRPRAFHPRVIVAAAAPHTTEVDALTAAGNDEADALTAAGNDEADALTAAGNEEAGALPAMDEVAPALDEVPLALDEGPPALGEAAPEPGATAPQPAPAAATIALPDRPAFAPTPQEPAPQEPAPQDGRPPRRRLPLAWVIFAAAAVVAVAGVLIGLNIAGHHAPLAPAAAGSSPAASSGPHSSAAASTAPQSTPSGGGRAAVPAGYHRYRDPTGFSIAVPNGWTVSHQGHYVYIQPPSGGMFLLIDQTDHPQPNPLADWRQQEANRRGTYPGYHRIRLEAIRYPQAEKAADWEFTYYRQGLLTHVLNRNVLANARHAYALYWSTPGREWNQSFHIFQVLASTFRPAPA